MEEEASHRGGRTSDDFSFTVRLNVKIYEYFVFLKFKYNLKKKSEFFSAQEVA